MIYVVTVGKFNSNSPNNTNIERRVMCVYDRLKHAFIWCDAYAQTYRRAGILLPAGIITIECWHRNGHLVEKIEYVLLT